MYPITRLIDTTRERRGISRGDLARTLGYRNTAKALRRLDDFRRLGDAAPDFQARLTAALGVDPTEFGAAMDATREVLREEKRLRREAEEARARAAFRPHLRVIPERRIPSPIFVAALTGVEHWLVQELPPDIMAMPEVRCFELAGEIARAHYARENGGAGPFGAIRGYLFRTTFDTAIELAVDGTNLGPRDGPVPMAKAAFVL